MTGVRPVRLVHDKRAAGWTEEQIDDFPQAVRLLARKVRDGQAIADLQEPI